MPSKRSTQREESKYSTGNENETRNITQARGISQENNGVSTPQPSTVTNFDDISMEEKTSEIATPVYVEKKGSGSKSSQKKNARKPVDIDTKDHSDDFLPDHHQLTISPIHQNNVSNNDNDNDNRSVANVGPMSMSENHPLESATEIQAKKDFVELVWICVFMFVWFSSSVVKSLSNKAALNELPKPVTLLLTQLLLQASVTSLTLFVSQRLFAFDIKKWYYAQKLALDEQEAASRGESLGLHLTAYSDDENEDDDDDDDDEEEDGDEHDVMTPGIEDLDVDIHGTLIDTPHHHHQHHRKTRSKPRIPKRRDEDDDDDVDMDFELDYEIHPDGHRNEDEDDSTSLSSESTKTKTKSPLKSKTKSRITKIASSLRLQNQKSRTISLLDEEASASASASASDAEFPHNEHHIDANNGNSLLFVGITNTNTRGAATPAPVAQGNVLLPADYTPSTLSHYYVGASADAAPGTTLGVGRNVNVQLPATEYSAHYRHPSVASPQNDGEDAMIDITVTGSRGQREQRGQHLGYQNQHNHSRSGQFQSETSLTTTSQLLTRRNRSRNPRNEYMGRTRICSRRVSRKIDRWLPRLIAITPFTFLHLFAHLFTQFSLVILPVWAVKVVKSLSPIFAVFLARIFLGEPFSLLILLSLLPIAAGVGLVGYFSHTTSSGGITPIDEKDLVSPYGLLLCATGAALFVAEKVTAKGLFRRNKSDPFSLLIRSNYFAACMLVPFWLLHEGLGPLMTGLSSSTITFYWFINGAVDSFLGMAMLLVLTKLSATAHQVANAGDRLFVLMISVLVFGNVLQNMQIVGIVVSLLGMACYNSAKHYQTVSLAAAQAKELELQYQDEEIIHGELLDVDRIHHQQHHHYHHHQQHHHHHQGSNNPHDQDYDYDHAHTQQHQHQHQHQQIDKEEMVVLHNLTNVLSPARSSATETQNVLLKSRN